MTDLSSRSCRRAIQSVEPGPADRDAHQDGEGVSTRRSELDEPEATDSPFYGKSADANVL
jgi:hypothetical protein